MTEVVSIRLNELIIKVPKRVDCLAKQGLLLLLFSLRTVCLKHLLQLLLAWVDHHHLCRFARLCFFFCLLLRPSLASRGGLPSERLAHLPLDALVGPRGLRVDDDDDDDDQHLYRQHYRLCKITTIASSP